MKATGTGCALYGQSDGGTTYTPPNAWEEEPGGPANFKYRHVTPAFTLPAPPAGQGLARELAYLKHLQLATRPSLLPQIHNESLNVGSAYDKLLGMHLWPQDSMLQTVLFVGNVVQAAKYWVLQQKGVFNRARPVQFDESLSPPFCPGHASYPSGHAIEAFGRAKALALAMPRFTELHAPLHSLAWRIAWHREVAGVHYPSDSRCGELMAQQLIDALRADPADMFEQDRAAAQAELDSLWGT